MQIADRAARTIPQGAQASGDGLDGRKIVGAIPFVFDQGAAHFFDAHTGRSGIAAAFGVIATPGFDHVADVVQEVGQAFFDRLAPSQNTLNVER